MIRLISIWDNGHEVSLLPPSLLNDKQNVFTVVVGKNGLGKSRLLATIAKQCIQICDDYDGTFFRQGPTQGPVVIAASTSPFDKFPTPQRRKGRPEKNYRYIGTRGEGMYAATSSVALLSSVTRGLLSKLLHQSNRADLLGLFKSLTFDPSFEFIFKPAFSRTQGPGRRGVQALEGRNDYYIEERFAATFSRMSTEERSAIEYAVENVGELFEKRKACALVIDFLSGKSMFDGQPIHPFQINSLLMLMEVGLVRLMDIRTEKQGHGALSLRAASSGEQCILVLMLGIASYIENGSLILIDEPEISLHPEWQEEFMDLLTSSFANYYGCQFVIATHSPQITARLRGSRAFVHSLGKRELISASEFMNKSADFQLAELFDSPGRMNEYISRLCFNLIALIRSNKTHTAETLQGLAKIRYFKRVIDHTDPLRELIESIEELHRQHD